MIPDQVPANDEPLQNLEQEEHAPANDNDESGDDAVTPNEAANSNGYQTFDRDPRAYGYVSVPGRLERLLDRAGYDPLSIPSGLRRTAFEVALCFEKRMFDRDDIAQTLGFTRGQVRRSIEALRIAARPGTTVA